MTEQLISFKTAKLAKRKKFKFNSIYFYNPTDGNIVNKWIVGGIEAPPQSLLQKRLREEYNIEVEIKLNDSLFKRLYQTSHKTTCLKYRWTIYYNIDNINYIYESFGSTYTFSTYEEALEDGLKIALKSL